MKRLLVPVLALLLAVAVAGCGSDDSGATEAPASSSATPSTSPSESDQPSETVEPSEAPETPEAPEGTVVEISIKGDDVSPSGERVKVGAGETVTLLVTSDRPGEIHVHSTPEQELGYDVGTTELTLTIDKPGVVEVEDHDADLVLVQLQVS